MDTSSVKTCVVFRLGRLGDVVLSSGVLARWAEDFNLDFIFVTRKDFAPVLDGAPFIKDIISLADADLKTAAFFHFCRTLAGSYGSFPLIDLHLTPRSHLLSLFWRAPVRSYAKMSLARRIFLASGGQFFRQSLLAHNVPQRYYRALNPNPPPATELAPRIYLSRAELEAARARLDAVLFPGARPLALHIHAAHALKAIPETTVRGLARLLEERRIPLLILGRGRRIFSDRAWDLTNCTSLREMCALLSLCRALVSSDSGPLHLAGAVSTASIALFGPTTREWGFYPCGPRDIILEKDLACRPCSLHGGTGCDKGGNCMARITPEEIMRAIEQVDGTG
ncbi:MAG: glycosyltransferase family 9 protein [Desulfovibrio sp.]|jgi:ADP-heptose:LPS heptosyltransferase|nr:glycosyltransferase family 9 protein [Desulfovibrio sp.]